LISRKSLKAFKKVLRYFQIKEPSKRTTYFTGLRNLLASHFIVQGLEDSAFRKLQISTYIHEKTCLVVSFISGFDEKVERKCHSGKKIRKLMRKKNH